MNTPRATYQDVLDAPPHKVAEVIEGVLHTMPRPAVRHARAGSGLGVHIGGPFDYDRNGPGGWWILCEPELHLGEDIVVPDLAGWRRSRLPKLPDSAYFEMVPDWVCEILSPSTRAIDLGPKKEIYAREGARHLWFVDPDAHFIEAFELQVGAWASCGKCEGNDTVALPPFDSVSFRLGTLWFDWPARSEPRRVPQIHDRARMTA